MRELPILFSAFMVRAILQGRKTQTRRVVKPDGADHLFQFRGTTAAAGADEPTGEWGWCGSPHVVKKHLRCPYGKPGDRLWVRETWGYRVGCGVNPTTEAVIEYRADSTKATLPVPVGESGLPKQRPNMTDAELLAWSESWRPSIHMPRWASRITLEVTGVRVERLRDISDSDVLAEGFHTREGDAAFNYDGTREYFLPELLESEPTGAVAAGGNVSAQQAFRRLWESINGTGSWNANPWVWVVEFRRIEQGAIAA